MEKAIDIARNNYLVHIQQLQNHYAGVTTMGAVLTGPKGKIITKPSRTSLLYAEIEQNEQGLALLRESRNRVYVKCRDSGGVSLMACPYTGLLMAGVPLMQSGLFLGCWIVGQVRTQGHTEYYLPYLSRLGVKTGLDPRMLKNRMRELSYISPDDFWQNLQLLQSIAATVFLKVRVGGRSAGYADVGQVSG